MTAQSVWNFILWFHYTALALWVGGIAFLCAVAAPSVHRSMASKAVAGEIVGKMLHRLNTLELACALILIATLISSYRFVYENKRGLAVLIILIVIMGFLACFYTFRITPQMEALKANVPTLDTLSPQNDAKLQFNKLHHLYVQLMGLNLLLGLGAIYGSVVVLK